MFNLEIGKFCFKFNNALLPETFSGIFIDVTSIHSYNTRNSQNRFYRSQYLKKSGSSTLNYLGPQLWNNIPNNIKNKSSIYSFKISYKNYLLQKYQDVNQASNL